MLSFIKVNKASSYGSLKNLFAKLVCFHLASPVQHLFVQLAVFQLFLQPLPLLLGYFNLRPFFERHVLV